MENKIPYTPPIVIMGYFLVTFIVIFFTIVFMTMWKISKIRHYKLIGSEQITTPIDEKGEWYSGDADTLYLKKYTPKIENIEYGPYWTVTTPKDPQSVLAIKWNQNN